VNTSDLPVDTGLKKPVEVKNLEVNADLKGQEARISNLSFRLFNGEAKRMVT
jgi:AsmA protein